MDCPFEEFPLPYPLIRKNVPSVEEAIASRRSIRSFKNQPISIEQLSQILWAAYGVTDVKRGFLSTPSAGATFPLELYVVVGKNTVKISEDRYLEAAIYKYDNYGHKLLEITPGDYRDALFRASLRQPWVKDAAVDIIICAIYERTTMYYGERGYRYVYMEVGHAGQNIYLITTALGLGTVAIGAFRDSEVKQLLRLPHNIHPLYIMPIGVPEQIPRISEKELAEFIETHRRCSRT